MNILDILTKEDLMKPPDIRDGRNYGGYNLTACFIRKRGKAMGRYAGRFSRDLVEKYLNQLYPTDAQPLETIRTHTQQLIAAADDAAKQARYHATVTPIEAGKPLGRGGRRRPALQAAP